jgi:alcohol dehydrogenase (cytochrome c)
MIIKKITAATAALFTVGLAVTLVARPQAQAQTQPAGPTFAAAQAETGKTAYTALCAGCHGSNLEGGGEAPSLSDDRFRTRWGGSPALDLINTIRRMPPGTEPRSPDDNAAILAYLLRESRLGSAGAATPSDDTKLAALRLPGGAAQAAGGARGGGGGGGGRRGGGAGPALTFRGSPKLSAMTDVTDANLANPSPADWINWRRTRDGLGFSPLAQVNRGNVKGLKLAWSWSLPRGDNMMTPLVHDGVLYAYSFGDVIEAFDAATGDLLWRYARPASTPSVFTSKKGLAISGHTLLVPTSDLHMLALDTRTGQMIWDHAIDIDGQKAHQIKSAPLIVKDKVIIGLNGYQQVQGGNFVVALDIATGKEAWRFYTIARPGQEGDNSWNGLPVNKRSGGSVWVGETYDAQTGLVYFGTAPTYDVVPLRVVTQPGVTNDALYTDATIALDPETGKLVWYYQHEKNDQLDHDWVFERQIMDMMVGGVKRRVVITAGKQAIYEVLDAKTGKYLFSMDLGMQNTIDSIDPVTGEKHKSPAAIPGASEVLQGLRKDGICPNAAGAHSLDSASYNPTTKLLYVPLADVCVNPKPGGPQWQKNPTPETKGKFGMLQAIDLEHKKVVWTAREVPPPVSAALATAGGLVFNGDADRWFKAYDDKTGKLLWRTRLDNIPTSSPITFQSGGKQYIAVSTTGGNLQSRDVTGVAGLAASPNDAATLWVFSLGD